MFVEVANEKLAKFRRDLVLKNLFDNNFINTAQYNSFIKEKIDNPKLSYDEVIENLKVQLSQYAKEADKFNKLALKAEGALEVLVQMKDQEVASKGDK